MGDEAAMQRAEALQAELQRLAPKLAPCPFDLVRSRRTRRLNWASDLPAEHRSVDNREQFLRPRCVFRRKNMQHRNLANIDFISCFMMRCQDEIAVSMLARQRSSYVRFSRICTGTLMLAPEVGLREGLPASEAERAALLKQASVRQPGCAG